MRNVSISGHFLGFVVWFFLSVNAVAEVSFDDWVADFWPTAQTNGISREVYQAAFDGITPDPTVLEAAENQAEFVRAVWDYLDSAVSDTRVSNGEEALSSLTQDLAAIQEKWGVDRTVLTAIWGIESSYGWILDKPKIVKNVIRSLATLGYQGGPRSRFGRTQLLAALKILQSGDTTPDKLTGSWAGAMGHTQFIPTTYLAHAVDYDGDGKRNIWSSPQDALASAANYLKVSGWQAGRTWGYEVKLPENFDFDLADGKTKKPLADWQKIGVKQTNGTPFLHDEDLARLFLPGGASGPAFLLLKNFDVIKRYNNADAYALAVGHLSDRLKGLGPVEGTWPRDLKPLSREQKKELQTLLTARGFDTGGVDGLIGPKSRAAVRAFQKSRGAIPDGFVSTLLLEKLKS